MKDLDKVLKVLKSDYGWDFYDTLTKQGERLVEDTLKAQEQIKLILPAVGKSFFTRMKISWMKSYYKMFLAKSKVRFENKPNTLKLAKRFYRYKMYLLNK